MFFSSFGNFTGKSFLYMCTCVRVCVYIYMCIFQFRIQFLIVYVLRADSICGSRSRFKYAVVTQFISLIHSLTLEKMAAFVLTQGKWLQPCLSPKADFINRNKIWPNASICEPNFSWTERFMNRGITV